MAADGRKDAYAIKVASGGYAAFFPKSTKEAAQTIYFPDWQKLDDVLCFEVASAVAGLLGPSKPQSRVVMSGDLRRLREFAQGAKISSLLDLTDALRLRTR